MDISYAHFNFKWCDTLDIDSRSERGDKEMRFIDLFSGIGGFRLGMESVGHECIGFCEIDKFARESYKSIFQTEGEIEFHDIRDVSDDEFKKLRGKVDIICGDSLVKHFQSQEDDWDLKILEELCSLKLLGRPNKSNHVFFFLKMLKAYSITIRDGRSPQFLPHLMSWGLMLSGRCLTVRILAFPKTERGCLLSDILERKVPDSYFLSDEKVKQLTLRL